MRHIARGVLYLSASEIHGEPGYADVTPKLLRAWATAGRLPAVTVAELAAALGAPVAAGVDGTAAARVPGPSGDEYVYRWHDVTRAETDTRLARRTRGGRPRHARPP